MFKTQVISFNKILWVELKNITKLLNLLPILIIPVGVSMYTVIEVYANSMPLENQIVSLKMELWVNIATLYTFLLLWKILADIFSTENKDKNITIFLTNNKHTVFLSKLISNIIILSIPLLIYIGIEWLIITNGWHGKTTTPLPPIALRIFVAWIANIILYVCITWFIQLIAIMNINKWTKNIISICVLFIVITFYWIISKTASSWTLKNPNFLYDAFRDNSYESWYKKWVYYIPIINIMTVSSFFQIDFTSNQKIGEQLIILIQMEYILPFIFEMLAMIIISRLFMTKKVTKKIKEYLCT